MTGQLSRADATLAPALVASVVGSSAEADICGSWSPSPSPDGSAVAFVSDRGGAPAAWIARRRGEPVLLDTGPDPVLGVRFSPDGAWIACEIAPGGAPRTELWVISPSGTGLRQVAGFAASNASFGSWVSLDGVAYLAVTERSSSMLVHPGTGDRRTLTAGALTTLLDITPDGRLALLRTGPRGQRQLNVLVVATGECQPLLAAADGSTDQGCFTADGAAVLARTEVGCDLARLVRIPLAPGATPTVLVERADAELEDFAVPPTGGVIALLWNMYGGRSEVTLLDVAVGTQRAISGLPGEVFSGCAFSADGSTLALCAEAPAAPRAIWRVSVDRAVARPVTVATLNPGLVTVPELHCFSAQDGLQISGWLYRPAGDGPFPTMVSLHAGPEAQERPGYNPLFQDLVSRGVAVFAPNVRGSAGFGRAFVNADNGAGRYGAIADVATCVAYLLSAGVAQGGRIGCMGRSYGGYLTLAALVTYPELFAVGVDVCGMADFATFYERTEPWIAAAAVSKYGHPVHDAELLRDLSPLHKLDQLAAPLLVVHGGNDSNVPVHEADQVVWALHKRGATYRYVLFPDEGHEFLLHANRRRYVAETVRWVTGYLVGAASRLP
jgi:dipeptidyl aminopeptidase/acylaminoacyl peptidase